MNAIHDLEQRIADYYETEAPHRAPDWLGDRILASVDTTPQRRTMLGRPWRFPAMNSFAKLAAGAVAIVAFATVGLTLVSPPAAGPGATAPSEAPSSPSATPAPSTPVSGALPPPLTERFESTSHGISMDYPAGWQTRRATERWTDGVINFDAPGVDIIFDPARGDDLYFAVASEPLDGRLDHAWRDDLTLPGCPGGAGGGTTTFDGASGWVFTCGGLPGRRHSAILATDAHGYAIVLYLGDEGLIDTYTDTWFVSVLETLDLRAE
jgi:hypothetical protein